MNNKYYGLTPENSALLLIDHQVNLLNSVKTLPVETLRKNIIALARMGQLFNLPTLLTTNGASGPNGTLIPDLIKLYPDAEVLDRTIINSWEDPAFVSIVKKFGRKKLIMAAISTDVCLTFPAVSAAQDGYEVYGVIDASGTGSHQVEQMCCMRMMQAGVILTNWISVATELQRDWKNKETGKPLIKVMIESM